MVTKLWLMMMGLVLFSILFMWTAQIFLFESHYKKAALSETLKRLEPVMEPLQTGEFSSDERSLSFLSRILDGRILLFGSDGKLKDFYSYGYKASLSPDDPEYHMLDSLRNDGISRAIADREPFQQSHIFRGSIVSVEIGIPVIYNGRDGYLVLKNETNIGTVLRLNRRQVLGLSLLLTVAASLLASVCSRHFSKPIYEIRDTIERLAENDYSAKIPVTGQNEISQLASAVNTLGEDLQQVESLRREVIANVSHELKSPLAVISGYAEMVRDIDWRFDEKREEDLNLIIQESGRMSEMVNDILDYSRLQSGHIWLSLETCDLCEIAESEMTRCLAQAAGYQIAIDFKPDVQSFPVSADPLKMSQVLRNLLNNAVNHTPSGEHVTIYLTVPASREKEGPLRAILPSENAAFRLSVCNPGEPIPEKDRTLIWERYQRSQHVNGRSMGTGIGLSIVKTILEAHQMPFGVDCENGQTIFWLENPSNLYYTTD